MTLKILFLINGLGTGGSERSLAELLPRLGPAGIAPGVVCLFRRTEGVETEVLRAGFDVRFLEARSLLGRVLALRRILRRERPGLLHTTHFEASLAGRLAALGLGVPVLTSLVATSYTDARRADPALSPFKLAAVRALDGFTARHLNRHFHAVSASVKTAAVAALRLDPAKVTVVERGRDPERLGKPGPERRRRARAALGLAEGDQVVVNVGRLEPQKGQRYLLEACARLAPAHPRLRLLIAGRDGRAAPELRRLGDELGLGERVRFLGHRDDVPELLAAADVFAFPSLYEGLPGAVIEAMALGLPIAGSTIGPLLEVVEPERNALLAAPAEAEPLAAALGRLLDDPALAAAFGRRSREIFLERFTLERSAARMIELFRRAAAGE